MHLAALVVDREPAIRHLLDRILTPLGFLVRTVSDPAEAQNTLLDSHVDLILIDADDPSLSSEAIASIRELSAAPIIATSTGCHEAVSGRGGIALTLCRPFGAATVVLAASTLVPRCSNQ